MTTYTITPSFVVGEDGTTYDVPRDERAYVRKANSRDAAFGVIKHLAGEYATLSEGMRLGIDITDRVGKQRFEAFADEPMNWRVRA